ncbi:MAG: hypothetical protein ACK494_16585 [Planctomycetota bacterium]
MLRSYLVWPSLLVFGLAWIQYRAGHAQDGFDLPPIRYSATSPNDPIAVLQRKIASGEVVLQRDARYGYLPSLLQELSISEESQVLVFSKTSLQIHKISPSNPRAIYYNDSVYVGYVPGSEILELAANDPAIGAVFYTLDGSGSDPDLDTDAPHADAIGASGGFQLVRDRGNCLSCHATTRTENVPGYLVRSIFPDRSGRPRTGASSYTTDYRSPWKQRWGGWYVTGNHGAMRHMGNAFATDREDPQKIDVESGANLPALPPRVRPANYPVPSSDLVSLLVLEHQTRVHNLITRANYETRQAVALDEAMNRALGRPEEHRSESTQRRIASAANALAEALLMADEPKLEQSVSGTSRFREVFEARGPITASGASLRQFDLNDRLFKYPLSYLIYTPEFQELPQEVMRLVQARVIAELSDGENAGLRRGLVPQNLRPEIRPIVAETLPGWFQ